MKRIYHCILTLPDSSKYHLHASDPDMIGRWLLDLFGAMQPAEQAHSWPVPMEYMLEIR